MIKIFVLVALLLISDKLPLISCSNDYEDYKEFFTEESTTEAPVITSSSRSAVRMPAIKIKPDDNEEWESPEECDLHQKCVSYYLCKEDGNINSDGSYLIDERLETDGEATGKSCPNLEQCCNKENFVSEIPLDGKKIDPADKEQICGLDSVFHTPDQCGFHNKKGLGGVVKSMQGNINYAQFAEFPWMAAIIVNRNVNGTLLPVYQNGGSLIHPRVVLTSAHNILNINPNKLIVRAGEWDTQTTNEICPYEERKVQKIIVHENFKRANLQNNLALLILNEEFPMSPYINTVCLPPKNTNFDNQRCFSSGWGKGKFGKTGLFQVFLKKVELPVVPHAECQDKLRKTRLGDDFILNKGFLCAGGEEGKDLCTGDGGSPLVCPIDASRKNFYQAGIVVGGIGCGAKDVPGFYTDVAKFRDWIDAKVIAQDFETANYIFK